MHSRSDPDTVPVVSLNDWDDDVWASSSSSTRFTSSPKDTSPSPARSSHSFYRRRTSESPGATGHSKIPLKIQHLRAESSNTVRGHPLKRDSGGFPSSIFNDPTVTRPILNLRLSPGRTVDVDKNPLEADDGMKVDPCEREELVLVHEVGPESDDRHVRKGF